MRERKQAERRARVVQAAMQLAREGGYDAVQMREVSARADVALGTIYRYFASKDEILTEGLVRWVEHLRDRIAIRPRRGATTAEQVADAMRAASRVPDDAAPLLRALMTAMSSPSISVATKSRELHELMGAIVRGDRCIAATRRRRRWRVPHHHPCMVLGYRTVGRWRRIARRDGRGPCARRAPTARSLSLGAVSRPPSP